MMALVGPIRPNDLEIIIKHCITTNAPIKQHLGGKTSSSVRSRRGTQCQKKLRISSKPAHRPAVFVPRCMACSKMLKLKISKASEGRKEGRKEIFIWQSIHKLVVFTIQ